MQIFTNLARTQIPEGLGPRVAQALAGALNGKPVERMAVIVHPDQLISLGEFLFGD